MSTIKNVFVLLGAWSNGLLVKASLSRILAARSFRRLSRGLHRSQPHTSGKPLRELHGRHKGEHVPGPAARRFRSVTAIREGLWGSPPRRRWTFLGAGEGMDGDNAISWPDEAKTAFSYAASIWAYVLNSQVRITVKACWADNLPAHALGHSRPLDYKIDFDGAPKVQHMVSHSAGQHFGGKRLRRVRG